jgi:hypothetical protein
MAHPDAETLDRVALDFVQELGRANMYEQRVPERFRFETQARGAVLSLQPRLFAGDRLAYGRVTRLRGGTSAQVLNIVMIPRLATALPVLAVEILSFVKGVHLVVFDIFPLHESDEGDLTDELGRTGELLEGRFTLEPRPDWGRSVFSEAAIIIRPGARSETRAEDVVEPLLELLKTYVEAIRQCSTARFDGLEQRRRERARYLGMQASEEPGREFLQRVMGEDWVHRFTHEFLYPDWLHVGDRVMPWVDHLEMA